MSQAMETIEHTISAHAIWRRLLNGLKASRRNTRLIAVLSLTAAVLGSALLLSTFAHSAQGTFIAYGPADFVRGPGGPDHETRTFSVLNQNTTYTLQIFNGGQNGQFRRTAKARVMLNGTRIVSHRDFRHRVAFVEKRITLARQNTLVVEVRGPRGDDDDRDDDDDDDRDDSRPASGFTLRIIGSDNDLPAIGATIDPTPSGNGWNNSNATVSFECSDRTSGIANCSAPVVVSTEGANQSVIGSATDRAGNTASKTILLNIDKTSPRITTFLNPSPNAAGWNNTDVTVSFNCTDELSGVAACAPPVIVTNEGSNRSVLGSAMDVAGNSATRSAIVAIDKSPPNLSITSPANGITVGQPTIDVGGSVNDSLSGIASITCNEVVATVSGGTFICSVPLVAGNNGITVRACDFAGNQVSAGVNAIFADAGPTVPPAWNGSWEVTVTSRNHDTGNIVTTDNTNGSICPGEPIIPPLLSRLFQCSTVNTETEISLSCHAAYSPAPNCDVIANATLNSHREGDEWQGAGNWTLHFIGQCGQPDYGEDFVLSATRVNGVSACNGRVSSLMSRIFPESELLISFATRNSQ